MMNITDKTERRVVVFDRNGCWTIMQLWTGPVCAADGFRIARETSKAIYFLEDIDGTPHDRQAE